MIRNAAVAVVLAIVTISASAQTESKLGKDDLSKVIAAMTVEEKARLLVGMGFRVSIPGLSTMSEEDAKIPERVPGAAGRTHAIERLGIPSLTLADGPAGVRIAPKREGDTKTYFATGFPVATAIASSWDSDLAERVGTAFGIEAREYGVDVLLAPGMNIQRNPLGGRNFEYYSEDPLVAGLMAAGFVRGVQSQGVGTSIKHYAVNNQEFNRFQSNSIAGERALREIYLRGFEIAAKEGKPWTVMSAYNLVNGTFASHNRDLLTDILRDEWGYGGLVMTDWFAGNDAAAQIGAGNDLLMPGTPDQEKAIIEAVRSGRLKMKDLDASVERALQLVMKSLTFNGVEFTSKPDLEANAKVSLDAATQGMVLLENNGALPAKPGSKLALYGIRSVETIAGGTGSGDVNKAYVIPVFKGLRETFEVDQYRINELEKHIASEKSKLPPPVPFFPNPPIPEMPVSAAVAEQDAAASDLAVITIGRDSGEFADLNREKDFELSSIEKEMISNVSKAFRAKGKKVVVLLNVGGPIETLSWRDLADAVLVIWQPGQEAGNAVAKVLSGEVNPSGKLAVTFPAKYEDVPSSKTFPGREIPGATPLINNPIAGKPSEAIYDEGVFVGYRYYSTFGVEPAYPFGYGLSYTSFEYSTIIASYEPGEGLLVQVDVKNNGSEPGREVVQVYVGSPAEGSPKRELRAFLKTREIKSGESITVEFTIPNETLAFFDPVRSAWVIPAGRYDATAGGDSWNGANHSDFVVEKEVVVRSVRRLLAPQVSIEELKAPAAAANDQ